jgi:hypothetical protein
LEFENEVNEIEVKAMFEHLGITPSVQTLHKLAQMNPQQTRMALILCAKEHTDTIQILRLYKISMLLATIVLIILFWAFIFK